MSNNRSTVSFESKTRGIVRRFMTVEQPDSRLIEVMDRMTTRLRASVVPIYMFTTPPPVHLATGNLLQIADRRFLVTAAHVVEDAVRGHHGLALCDIDVPNGKFAPLPSGRVIVRRHASDIAAWELTPETLAQLPNRVPLRLSDVEMIEGPVPNDLFIVHGYPVEWSNPFSTPLRGEIARFTWSGLPYAGTPEFDFDFDPKLHLMLHAPRENMIPQDELTPSPPERLLGISGSSVWKLNVLGRDSVWKPEDARVIGVETSVFPRKGAIRCTRWEAVISMLLDLEPSLRRVVEMHWAIRRPLPF